MASWILIPCLEQLFAEFDRIAPRRDKASDGRVGDTAHQQESSDHNPDETGNVPIHDADKVNEVHAIDVDNNLNESDLTMEKVVQFLLGRCRSGVEKRLRYIIYNRRIWSASSGWVQKTYSGASAHTEHAHFSASYETAREADTSSWHLADLLEDDMQDADWTRMAKLLEDVLRGVGPEITSDGLGKHNAGDAIHRWDTAGNEVPASDPNPYMSAGYTLTYQGRLLQRLTNNSTALLTAIKALPADVLDALADEGQSDEQTAAVLRAALGDRAEAVGRLLAAA